MNVLLLRVFDDGHIRHGESESISKLLLDRAEFVLVLLVPPHLAHAVFAGVLRRDEDARTILASSFFPFPLVFVLINLGLLHDNGP